MRSIARRARMAPAHCEDEAGFTIVELMVAMMIMATAMTAVAYGMFSGMNAYAASRDRSSALEAATAEMETLRALPYASVGVRTSDANYTSAYPSGQHLGAPAVVTTASTTPAAVSTVTASSVKAMPVPYTVRRWVTWVDPSGGSAQKIKRLEVKLQWTTVRGLKKSVTLVTKLYPGNQGAAAGNGSPVPTITNPAEGSMFAAGTAVGFVASATDPEGESVTFSWNFGDGTTAEGVVAPSHTYASSGLYTVELRATDTAGNTGYTARTLSISPSTGNTAPTAAFTIAPDPATGAAPLTVNVFADGSTDPENQPLTYAWDWADGTPAGEGVSAAHVYTTPGSYEIRLTVRDPGGLTSEARRTVNVTSVNCSITGGHFRNPPSNTTTTNEIVGNKHGKPNDGDIRFTAFTNSACTSVTGRLDDSAGQGHVVSLGLIDEEDGVLRWRGTLSLSPAVQLSTTSSQVAGLLANGTLRFSFGFNYRVV